MCSGISKQTNRDLLGRLILMKLGIIRCMQTEDYCPGTTDFKMIREHKGAFEGIDEEIELIGFCNCGGCPAKIGRAHV